MLILYALTAPVYGFGALCQLYKYPTMRHNETRIIRGVRKRPRKRENRVMPQANIPAIQHSELERRLGNLGVEFTPARIPAPGTRFVVKCGGTLLEDPATGDALLDDIALLAGAGFQPLLVHGGGVQADRDMEAEGIVPRRHRGLRITDEKTIRILDRCFGDLNRKIAESLSARGVRAVALHGASNTLLRARPMRLDDVDLGAVGEVAAVDPEALPADAVPVVSAIIPDEAGRPLNVNADGVAAGLALGVHAAALLLLTDVPGVLLNPEDTATLIPTLTLDRAARLIADGTIAGGMIPKVESAASAVRSGVPAVHLMHGKSPHAVLRAVFSDAGAGTCIISDGALT